MAAITNDKHRHRLSHGLGSKALSDEFHAITANPAQKPTAQLVEALKHMLANEALAKEVLACLASGAALSRDAKVAICHGLSSNYEGNAFIAAISPASTPVVL